MMAVMTQMMITQTMTGDNTTTGTNTRQQAHRASASFSSASKFRFNPLRSYFMYARAVYMVTWPDDQTASLSMMRGGRGHDVALGTRHVSVLCGVYRNYRYEGILFWYRIGEKSWSGADVETTTTILIRFWLFIVARKYPRFIWVMGSVSVAGVRQSKV